MGETTKPPSIRQRAFNCPHCLTLTSQTWYRTGAHDLGKDIPDFPDIELRKMVAEKDSEPDLYPPDFLKWIDTMMSGLIFLSERGDHSYFVNNLFLSQCYHCEKFAIWVHQQLIYPTPMSGPSPNPDLPSNVLRDYEEAGRIVGQSPRGAAALLRLAIEKLCKFLGEHGKDINDDIASLVKKGLSPVVQRSLDAVRVIGNEAVHPGKLDLKDDTAAAISLFQLVNIIAQQMISNPKHADEVYATLPENKRKEIEKRDAKP